MIIVDKGKEIEDRGVVLIQDGCVQGYCYIKLAQQLNQIDHIKSNLTPIADNANSRKIVKNYLENYQPMKIIRFGEQETNELESKAS